ncbi:hypothetical protein [Streptomyces sp. TR06-5]|uniref:hypothetical protein n=1 Tax=Streptomyces sp. TR06-5 TaxID=3385976 RepID=UPI0039A19000
MTTEQTPPPAAWSGRLWEQAHHLEDPAIECAFRRLAVERGTEDPSGVDGRIAGGPAMGSNGLWTGLNERQADGLACVACGRDYLQSPLPHYPVGRSATGSQVFACRPDAKESTGPETKGATS